jgi:hypothetical protein
LPDRATPIVVKAHVSIAERWDGDAIHSRTTWLALVCPLAMFSAPGRG